MLCNSDIIPMIVHWIVNCCAEYPWKQNASNHGRVYLVDIYCMYTQDILDV